MRPTVDMWLTLMNCVTLKPANIRKKDPLGLVYEWHPRKRPIVRNAIHWEGYTPTQLMCFPSFPRKTTFTSTNILDQNAHCLDTSLQIICFSWGRALFCLYLTTQSHQFFKRKTIFFWRVCWHNCSGNDLTDTYSGKGEGGGYLHMIPKRPRHVKE